MEGPCESQCWPAGHSHTTGASCRQRGREGEGRGRGREGEGKGRGGGGEGPHQLHTRLTPLITRYSHHACIFTHAHTHTHVHTYIRTTSKDVLSGPPLSHTPLAPAPPSPLLHVLLGEAGLLLPQLVEVHAVWLAALGATQEEGAVLGGAKGRSEGGGGEGRGGEGRERGGDGRERGGGRDGRRWGRNGEMKGEMQRIGTDEYA